MYFSRIKVDCEAHKLSLLLITVGSVLLKLNGSILLMEPFNGVMDTRIMGIKNKIILPQPLKLPKASDIYFRMF